VEEDLKTETPKPRAPRKTPGPIRSGQQLLFKPQVLELLDTAYVTLWGWMKDGLFPLPIELGPEDGRSTKVAWFADEVYAWLAERPRRKIGGLAQARAAQEGGQSKRRRKPRARVADRP
jgi:predicted DNA-binding transcriptional regulator AlpA